MTDRVPKPAELSKIRLRALAFLNAERRRDAGLAQHISRAQAGLERVLEKSHACNPMGWPEEIASILRDLCSLYDPAIAPDVFRPRLPSEILDFGGRVNLLLRPPVEAKNPDPAGLEPPDLNPAVIRIGRLEIDSLSKTVRLGRKTATIEYAAAFQAFLHIAQAEGKTVSVADIQKIPGCKGRVDRLLKNHLPEWVQALIPAQHGPGGGRALLLPKKGPR
jgi:hypothetical protein